eukprot:GHVU01026821.1.p2 GENE.GHVU01026821.1~~GHVU01026821.1.p2  ORF type:complete len:116 (+),score=26.46 GHVU01026821.1:446-793(+)
MFIGDGAKMVRDAFDLAKEKSPAVIFIDELDAVGTKRFDSELSGDREVQRTMLELLNQLDGFSSDDRVKARTKDEGDDETFTHLFIHSLTHSLTHSLIHTYVEAKRRHMSSTDAS